MTRKEITGLAAPDEAAEVSPACTCSATRRGFAPGFLLYGAGVGLAWPGDAGGTPWTSLTSPSFLMR